MGSGVQTSVLDVVKHLINSYKSNVNYTISGNFRLGDIRDNYADLTKITADLGFRAKVSFEDGIKLFCEWVKAQKVNEDSYNVSFEEMKNKGLLK